MNIKESNNINFSDIEIKVEKFDKSASVNKPSTLIITGESPSEGDVSLKECSFVKPEIVFFKTEEDDELTESTLNVKENADEYFIELKHIVPEEVYIKNEVLEEDQFNTNRINEREIKSEYLDVSESIAHEDITKTEDQEGKSQANNEYVDSVYEECRKTFTCKYCCTGLSMEKYKIAHERRCKLRKKKQYFGGTVFECSYCKLLYTREADKNKHQTVCKKRKESEKYKARTRKKGDRRYCCYKCNYESQWKSSLVRHIQIHDKTNAPQYSCNQCPYQTIYKSSLKTHLTTHNCFGLICVLCQKSFKRKGSLDAHYVSRHPDRSEQWGSTITHKMNECPKCNYKTVRTGDFKIHLATHGIRTDQTQFKCKTCGFKCIQKSNFITHLRLHVDQLPFVCLECHKRFNRKNHLDGHIVSRHSENEELMSSVTSKVHHCDKCDYKTVQNSELKKHLNVCS